ncbi:MAG: metalloregulator ArsR/SmtB family transcription factor [Phycisphaerae bacterium]|jgi:ArsR family transcriptional regulator
MAVRRRKIGRDTAEHVAEVLKAVANPVRIAIIEVLENGEMCVGDIVEALGGKQAIISQQLNMMKDKGVLSCRRDGVNVYYQIKNRNVIRLLECVRNHCDINVLTKPAGPRLTK